MSSKTTLHDLVKNFSTARQAAWNDVPFLPKTGRGDGNPILPFYQKAQSICEMRVLTRDQAEARSQQPSPPVSQSKTFTKFLTSLREALYSVDDASAPGANKDAAERVLAEYDTVPEARDFVELLKARNYELELVDESISGAARLKHVALEVKPYLQEYGLPRRSEPSDDDWASLYDVVRNSSTELAGCSLIYSYFLDEGGLPLTVERLADRVENGPSRTARPLQALHVKDDSVVAHVLSRFAVLWQQGELPAVDERRRQFKERYNFSLHAASRWGPLNTVDPRHAFPAAFHGFVTSALRFYAEQRNRQIDADVSPVESALRALANALREGNENLRRIKALEIRAYMEYLKRVFGVLGRVGDEGALANEWRAVLPGRPGLRDALAPWEYASDTVAALYDWRRAPAREFRTLAERSEVILVFCRVVSEMHGAAGPRAGELLALLDLLREPVTTYANSFRTVARVDLYREAFTGTPADAMARHTPPPAIPPLRRSWATEVPASV